MTPDTDRLLTSADVAALLGIARSTWSAYVSRGQAPPADDPELDRPEGSRLPRWKLSTVQDWRRARKGQGNHTSKLRGTK